MSQTKSKSYPLVLPAILGGTTDPEELVKLVHGRTVNKHGRQTIKASETDLFSKTRELTALCEQYYLKQYRRLQSIPGIKERVATAIIAEIGVDMKMFATATCLVG